MGSIPNNKIKKINIENAFSIIKNKYGQSEKKIEGDYNIYKYKPSTITESLKYELDVILCKTITDLNKLTKSYYRISEYESVTKNIDIQQKKYIIQYSILSIRT